MMRLLAILSGIDVVILPTNFILFIDPLYPFLFISISNYPIIILVPIILPI